MPVKNRFAELLPEITAWRRDFHEHPELLFDVHRTAAKVAELCRSFGCDEVVEGIGRTGVVAVIKGPQSDTKGRVIGLRADMDALPIKEQTGVPYASKTPGKMHACGHDGHTAMLLGAAKYLAETRNFDGTVVCIFQPAEEGGGGGREMVKDGMITRWNVEEVYGMHNMPGIPVGHFAIRPGALMAAADQFEIVVTGKGGHAAKPHDCIDTTVVAAHIIVAIQTIASRNVDPLKQVVISVCTVETDSTAHNVIPQVVKMKGHRPHDGPQGAGLRGNAHRPRSWKAPPLPWARGPRSAVCSAAIRSRSMRRKTPALRPKSPQVSGRVDTDTRP
jgi:amidohydrolase